MRSFVSSHSLSSSISIKCGGTGGCQGSVQWLGFNYTETTGLSAETSYPVSSLHFGYCLRALPPARYLLRGFVWSLNRLRVQIHSTKHKPVTARRRRLSQLPAILVTFASRQTITLVLGIACPTHILRAIILLYPFCFCVFLCLTCSRPCQLSFDECRRNPWTHCNLSRCWLVRNINCFPKYLVEHYKTRKIIIVGWDMNREYTMVIAVVLLTTPSYLLATVPKMARITILCAILGVKVGVKVATSSNSDARMTAPIARKICIQYVMNLKCCPVCCLQTISSLTIANRRTALNASHTQRNKKCAGCVVFSAIPAFQQGQNSFKQNCHLMTSPLLQRS